MAKEIDFKKTNLDDLYEILGFASPQELENKKTKLFPSGDTNKENQTVSIFLASLSAVKEYREELFSRLNGITKKFELHAYTEISNTENSDRPDALLVITSGKKPIIEWACFVEAKVENNKIEEQQIKKYIDFAKKIGIKNILTISNLLVSTPEDGYPSFKNYKGFALFHWSWSYLKSTALRLHKSDTIKDEDHIYIINELLRYFNNHKNINNYKTMGSEWGNSINEIHNYGEAEKIKDSELMNNIISSYIQEEKDISYMLTDETGIYVQLENKKSISRREEIEEMLNKNKIISSKYILNDDKKNYFTLEADFNKRKIECSTEIKISKGKARAQTSAIVEMFKTTATPKDIFICALYKRGKSVGATLEDLIGEKEKNKIYSTENKEYGDVIESFNIKTQDELGTKFKNPKNFVDGIENIATKFLTQIMVNKKTK